MGLDGGYVHSSTQTSRKDGWFEVIAVLNDDLAADFRRWYPAFTRPNTEQHVAA